MKKYYTDLDDYNDTSHPPIIDWAIRAVQMVIISGAIGLMLMICAAIEGY